MDRIAQEAYHRQRIIRWGREKGVTETSIRYMAGKKQKRYLVSELDDACIESIAVSLKNML